MADDAQRAAASRRRTTASGSRVAERSSACTAWRRLAVSSGSSPSAQARRIHSDKLTPAPRLGIEAVPLGVVPGCDGVEERRKRQALPTHGLALATRAPQTAVSRARRPCRARDGEGRSCRSVASVVRSMNEHRNGRGPHRRVGCADAHRGRRDPGGFRPARAGPHTRSATDRPWSTCWVRKRSAEQRRLDRLRAARLDRRGVGPA